VPFIESNVFGVRATLYSLVRPDGAPRFLLFPMIHIGSAEFYSQVHKRVDACDVILFDNWSQIPAHIRFAILLIAPMYGGYHFLTATKESIGKKMKSEDLESADEIMRADFAPGLDKAIMTSRDAKHIASIDSIVNSPATSATVGIVYGAGHMKAVTAALMEKHHYRVNGSEWLTVFDYSTD
jgi:hypothetical protein